jgi:hypothetical protein
MPKSIVETDSGGTPTGESCFIDEKQLLLRLANEPLGS